MYLVGGYKLPFFFVTCKIKDDNISTRPLINPLFKKISTIDFIVSKLPQNNFHSSNAFFTQSLACVHSLTSVNIFHLLIINLKKLKFQNWLHNRIFTISPLNNIKSISHNLNKRIICRSNIIKTRIKK